MASGKHQTTMSSDNAWTRTKLSWFASWTGNVHSEACQSSNACCVVHGVPKNDIDTESQTQEEIKKRLEYVNCESITVERVNPLRKRARNPNVTTQSIIIYTENPQEANDCITHGINIEHRHYSAEKYIPHCQIKQCFNCQGYGHKGDVCRKKPKCGKCAQEHETKQCKSESIQCANCDGAHRMAP